MDAPNIGPKLSTALVLIGVLDVETLTARGAIPVWEEFRAAGLFDCTHSLLALEGAIRGMRTGELDPTVREALRRHVRGGPR